MSKYHIVIIIEDKGDKNTILELLEDAAGESIKNPFEIKVVTTADSVGEGMAALMSGDAAEPGEFIVSYFSDSHKKVRYYVGPPDESAKPQWSYSKKDAAKLSEKACEAVSQLVAMVGYQTPMEIGKVGPTLGVIQGGKSDVSVGDFAAKVADDVIETIKDIGTPDETLDQ